MNTTNRGHGDLARVSRVLRDLGGIAYALANAVDGRPPSDLDAQAKRLASESRWLESILDSNRWLAAMIEREGAFDQAADLCESLSGAAEAVEHVFGHIASLGRVVPDGSDHDLLDHIDSMIPELRAAGDTRTTDVEIFARTKGVEHVQASRRLVRLRAEHPAWEAEQDRAAKEWERDKAKRDAEWHEGWAEHREAEARRLRAEVSL